MSLVLLLLSTWIACPHNGLPIDASDRYTILTEYYAVSPDVFCGTATRYGADVYAMQELRWIAQEAVEQYRHAGYVLLGGGYGYRIVDDEEYLLDNRASSGFQQIAAKGQHYLLTQNQLRLYMLGTLSEQDFSAYLRKHYVGVISLKSPNDIGREFCLYAYPDTSPIGTVIVGGTAAQHDWTPLGESTLPYSERLGVRINYLHGDTWRWSADLPDALYRATSRYGQHPVIRLESGRCNISEMSPN